MKRLMFVIVMAVALAGCVTTMPLQDQVPDVAYSQNDGVVVSVIDERTCVQEGRPKDFIGVARATFGVPVDWHVKQVLATEEGDKERDLSQWLEHRIKTGLDQKGLRCATVHLDALPDAAGANAVLTANEATWLIAMVLHQWHVDVNLNWVSAFNFDTDTDVHVFQVRTGEVFTRQFKERDVIDEKADESYRNMIIAAYKAQLQQILNDEDIRIVLSSAHP